MSSFSTSVWLALLSTCCLGAALALPYRRSYSYFGPLSPLEDYGPPVAVPQWGYQYQPNGWDVAEPYSEEETDDDMYSLPLPDYELQSLPSYRYELPQADEQQVWGQILNEEPEDELRALKRSGPMRPVSLSRSSVDYVTATPASVRVSTPAPPQVKHFLADASAQQFPGFRGQKEVPMLRPPNKPKDKITLSPDTLATTTPSPEPTIISAQQITSGERQKKPSPYDTLRKYLSIEDALKKEAEKRRAGNGNRHQKRNIIAEERSLTGQLRDLKKHLA